MNRAELGRSHTCELGYAAVVFLELEGGLPLAPAFARESAQNMARTTGGKKRVYFNTVTPDLVWNSYVDPSRLFGSADGIGYRRRQAARLNLFKRKTPSKAQPPHVAGVGLVNDASLASKDKEKTWKQAEQFVLQNQPKQQLFVRSSR